MNQVILINKNGQKRPAYDEAVRGVYVPSSFEMHAGASHWGRGRFLMKKSDYSYLWPHGGAADSFLQMADDTTGTGVKIPVIAAGYRHVIATTTTKGQPTTDDMVEAVFYDMRSERFSEMMPRYGYNVVNPADGTIYASTKNGGSEWTWADLASDLTVAFTGEVAGVTPTWQLRNLVFDGHTVSRGLDGIAEIIRFVVGFDWRNAGASMKFWPPDQLCEQNTGMLALAEKYRIGGGVSDKAAQRQPYQIQFMFRILPTDTTFADPMDAAKRWHTIDKTTEIPGSSGTMPFIMPNVAIYTSGALQNTGDLDTIATNMTTRIVAEYQSQVQEIVYAGLWPFVIDGKVQGVRWVADRTGARTFVRCNYSDAFLPWEPGLLAYELMQSTRVSAYGPTSSTVGPMGALVWSQDIEGGTCT